MIGLLVPAVLVGVLALVWPARSDVAQLCDWAIPIQNRHFVVVTEASQAISKAEDPAAIAS